MINGEIPALIADNFQKFTIQLYEGQQQLANFAEGNKALKELVESCNNNITALDNMVKALDKNSNKGNQGDQKNDEKKIQMMEIEFPSHISFTVTRLDVPMIL